MTPTMFAIVLWIYFAFGSTVTMAIVNSQELKTGSVMHNVFALLFLLILNLFAWPFFWLLRAMK